MHTNESRAERKELEPELVVVGFFFFFLFSSSFDDFLSLSLFARRFH